MASASSRWAAILFLTGDERPPSIWAAALVCEGVSTLEVAARLCRAAALLALARESWASEMGPWGAGPPGESV